MTEENQTPENDTSDEAVKASALDALKARADRLGIKYHPSIGEDKLREKINEALADKSGEAESKGSDAKASVGKHVPSKEEIVKRKALKLVRCRITCMNPVKSDWPGETISTGNSVTGPIKKFVPFDGEPYHIPQMMLNMLRERKFQTFYNVRDERGNKIRKGRQVPEFAIEELPPLTKAELKELARKQAMANGTADTL